MVAQWQRLFYDRRYMGVELKGIPDYVKIAEAYGAQGIRAQSMNEFEKALKTALKSDVATVIDVPINPEEDVFPFVVPNTSLKDMVIAQKLDNRVKKQNPFMHRCSIAETKCQDTKINQFE